MLLQVLQVSAPNVFAKARVEPLLQQTLILLEHFTLFSLGHNPERP
jgi:hypothetical protein